MAKTKAHQKYLLPDGREVPGVTTILNILNKPALVPWAWKMGRDGIDLNKARQRAFDVGTLTHAMIEGHLKGEIVDTSEYSKKDIDTAETAFLAFLDWQKGQDLINVDNEVQMIHPALEYGGTADWIAKNTKDEYLLIDFKTSVGGVIYPEHRYQVAAYRKLWEENQNRVRFISRCLILSLDKETGLPTPHILEDTERYFKIFDLCRQIYKLQKEKA